MAVPATATVPAAAFTFKICFRGHAAEFKRFAHELIDGLMHVMHFFLRFEETARHRVAEQGFAFLFKSRDFIAAQLLRALLLLLKRLAFGHESFVLLLCFIVRDEILDSFARRNHVRLVQNRLA